MMDWEKRNVVDRQTRKDALRQKASSKERLFNGCTISCLGSSIDIWHNHGKYCDILQQSLNKLLFFLRSSVFEPRQEIVSTVQFYLRLEGQWREEKGKRCWCREGYIIICTRSNRLKQKN
jgi:hypothetical protein